MSSSPSEAPLASHSSSAILSTEQPTPWTAKLKSPAVKNMSDAQLQDCISLGEDIADGKVDLRKLDEKSLVVRGKVKKGSAGHTTNQKRKEVGQGKSTTRSPASKKVKVKGEAETGKVEEHVSKERGEEQDMTKKDQKRHQRDRMSLNGDIRAAFGILPSPPKSSVSSTSQQPPVAAAISDDLHELITTSGLTPFRQRVLLGLCQIPQGSYSTYLALSNHLDSSPRAVGNALRNNPFAPRVPCHRIVAAGGGIGGFNGDWGDNGRFCVDKVSLLRDEGVVIEEYKGKLTVKGKVWDGFLAVNRTDRV